MTEQSIDVGRVVVVHQGSAQDAAALSQAERVDTARRVEIVGVQTYLAGLEPGRDLTGVVALDREGEHPDPLAPAGRAAGDQAQAGARVQIVLDPLRQLAFVFGEEFEHLVEARLGFQVGARKVVRVDLIHVFGDAAGGGGQLVVIAAGAEPALVVVLGQEVVALVGKQGQQIALAVKHAHVRAKHLVGL